MRSSRPSTATLAVLFAVSGCAALSIETTWLRWFHLLFGATAPATSATLVAFLVGQVLGAVLAARRARASKRPLRAYGLLEIGAAVWALAVPALLGLGEATIHQSYTQLAASPWLLVASRFGIACIATLPASICLGAAFPYLAAGALAQRSELGSRGTGLYAANLSGAVVGIALGVALPSTLGIFGSYTAAVALGLGAGCVAFVLGRNTPPRPLSEETAPHVPPDRAPATLGPRGAIAIAGLSGFGSFALQVLLVQAFGRVLDQSVVAFALVLSVVLAGLAAGSAAVSGSQRRQPISPEIAIALGLGIAGLGAAAFPAILWDLTGGLGSLSVDDPAASYAGSAFRWIIGAAGIPLLGAGLVLPAAIAAVGVRGTGAAESQLARLLVANGVGSIAGALAAPYVLIGPLGLWTGFGVLALVYAGAAVLVPVASRRARLWRDMGLAMGWILILTRASPFALPAVRAEAGERLLEVASSPAGVMAVVERDGERILRTDNHYSLGGSADAVHQRRQGRLALALAPEARRIAWIGSATGISAGAVMTRAVDALYLVEIAPNVALAGANWFQAENRDVHRAPATRVVLDDARNFLAATDESFDLIVADLFVPWRAGTGSLYSREHFAAARDRLAPDGVFVHWLPLYQLDTFLFRSIAATFLDAFPNSAVFRGDFFGAFPIVALVGYKGAVPSAQQILDAGGESGEDDRWIANPAGLWSLYVGPLAALPRIETTPRNTDDRPIVEFAAARAHRGQGGLDHPMTGLRWIKESSPLTQIAATRADPVFRTLDPSTRQSVSAGAAIQTASAHWTEGNPTKAAQWLEQAQAALPPTLLDPADPDPTAAEVWPDTPK